MHKTLQDKHESAIDGTYDIPMPTSTGSMAMFVQQNTCILHTSMLGASIACMYHVYPCTPVLVQVLYAYVHMMQSTLGVCVQYEI